MIVGGNMMKRCSAKPYEGDKKFIFVSYCHKDSKYVFPIIEQLAKDGYRVWYDEGIDPGSEWPEIIAHHLNGCAACVAFISENSLNSHNCRREINFALLKKKPFISVVLEEVKMSLGMEMQLSATQSIFKYTLPNNYEFFKKLYEAKFLYDCLGMPDPSIIVSDPSEYGEQKSGLFAEEELKRDTFSDKWFIEKNEHQDEKIEEKVKEKPVEKIEEKVESEVKPNIEHKPKVETSPAKAYSACLIRIKTNEKINIPIGETKLGRSNTSCDYAISGNSAIGRFHARLINKNGVCFVVDNNSTNKTYLNDKRLDPEVEYKLADGDVVRLANEKFSFHEAMK